MDKKFVLFASDEPETLNLMTSGLKREFNGKFIILRASNVHQAGEIIKASKVDYLVIDIEIPVTSGVAFLHKTRRADRNIKTIVTDGVNDLLTRERCNELGVAAYLPKPYSLDDLVGILKEL